MDPEIKAIAAELHAVSYELNTLGVTLAHCILSDEEDEAMRVLMMICPSHRWAAAYATLFLIGFVFGYVWAS
jgi:hypothetical protein